MNKHFIIVALGALILSSTFTITKAAEQGNSAAQKRPSATTTTTTAATTTATSDSNSSSTKTNTVSATKDKSAQSEVKTGLKDWKASLDAYKTANQAAKLERLKSFGATLIENRLASLLSLQTRITNMTQIEKTTKTALDADISQAITALTTLGTKIQADTDLTTLKTDIKSIYETYRIYGVVLPQSLGKASVARGQYILGRLTALETKLQATITSQTNAGKDMTEVNKLVVEFNAKIADAKTQLDLAETQFKSLTPTKTEEAKLARSAGKEAFEKAKEDLKAAHTTLKQILDLLPSPSTSISNSPTTSASVTANPSASVSASTSKLVQ